MQPLSFEGRTVIVTGAGGGLGRAYTLAIASRGGSVVANDIAGAEETVDLVATGSPGSCLADASDITAPAGAAELVRAALDQYGRIDAVVNNAGILVEEPFESTSTTDLDAVLAVHLNGAFLVTQAAWPHLRAAGAGRVVMTTSNAGLLGAEGLSAYAAAKMALVGLASVLAAEGRSSGIAVNAVAPIARTGMRSKSGRTAEVMGRHLDRLSVEAVASVVAYLCHPSCQASGEVFSAAAGRVARFFVGLGEGLLHEDLQPEDIASALSTARSLDGWTEPRSITDELVQLAGLLDGLDGATTS